MGGLPDICRIGLSPFRTSNRGLHAIVGDLTTKGVLPEQFCIAGSPTAIGSVASAIDPRSAAHADLLQLARKTVEVSAPGALFPVVASIGPITDILFKDRLWLDSRDAKSLEQHFANGDVVLAVNANSHDQFMHAARLLLRYGDGNLQTHVFRWPSPI